MGIEKIEVNEDALRKIFEQAATNIEAADQKFRETHSGLPVEVIVADFEEFGPPVQPTDAQLEAYAAAVSAGEPFEWVLTAE